MDDAADAGLIRFTLPQNLQLRFGNLTVMVSEPEGSPRSIWSEDSKTLLASNARSTLLLRGATQLLPPPIV